MKVINYLFLLLGIVLISNPTFAQDFEGIITMSSIQKSDSIEMEFMIKSDKIAMVHFQKDVKMRLITQKGSSDIYMIFIRNDAEFALKVNPDKMPMANFSHEKEERVEEDIKILKTGKRKQIGEYMCDEYVITRPDGNSAQFWVTKDLDIRWHNLFDSFEKVSPNPFQGDDDWSKIDGFIMEFTAQDEEDSTPFTVTFDVTKKQLEDSWFKPSPDAEILDMTDPVKMMEDLQTNPEKMQKMQEFMGGMN